jgi:hypothetical protein
VTRQRCLLVREVVELLGEGAHADTVRRLQAVEVVIEWPDRMPAPAGYEATGGWRVAEVVGEGGMLWAPLGMEGAA